MRPLQLNPEQYEIDLRFDMDEDKELAQVLGRLGPHPVDFFVTKEEAIKISRWFGRLAKEIQKVIQ